MKFPTQEIEQHSYAHCDRLCWRIQKRASFLRLVKQVSETLLLI